MRHDETVYLRHILDAIAKIETYLVNVNEQTFYSETLIHDGVIRQLEIIGEAVKRISGDTRKLQPQIPWSAIAGMRDKLIHHYFMVDLNQVWLTAALDLAPLKIAVTEMLIRLQSSNPTDGVNIVTQG